MRYLIINGSPHKGNTWKLVEIVKNDLKELDTHVQIHEIHLAELDIPFCIGCSNCFRKGYEKCPHYLKIKIIVESIEQADGVIIASSTYNMQATAMLKNLFDHLCFFLHRPHFFQKKAMIVTTTGGVGGMAAAKEIAATLYGIGFNRCYLFSQSSFSWNDYKPVEKTKKRLRKKTIAFYQDVKSKKLYGPSYKILIPYNLFRGMSLFYTKDSEFPTKDGEHWTKKYRKNKVYDALVFVPRYKRPIGHFFYAIGKFAGSRKKFQVTYKK